MTQKDLAEAYLTKAKENAIYFKKGKFPNLPLYQENDIKAAFNAGRESVMDNIPELKWECSWKYYFAATPLGCYSTNSFDADMLFYNGTRIPAPIGNVESNFEYVKQAAIKDYKKRIKQALKI